MNISWLQKKKKLDITGKSAPDIELILNKSRLREEPLEEC